jgi:heme/copper-type cytochrome/quinol oxidase subunit 4
MSDTYTKKWPTWVVIVAILILAIPIIWGLSIFMHILAAMSIGGILVVAGIIGAFIWLEKRVD